MLGCYFAMGMAPYESKEEGLEHFRIAAGLAKIPHSDSRSSKKTAAGIEFFPRTKSLAYYPLRRRANPPTSTASFCSPLQPGQGKESCLDSSGRISTSKTKSPSFENRKTVTLGASLYVSPFSKNCIASTKTASHTNPWSSPVKLPWAHRPQEGLAKCPHSRSDQ
jgi:hypothetical protein